MMIKVLLEFFGWCIVIVILVEVLLWVQVIILIDGLVCGFGVLLGFDVMMIGLLMNGFLEMVEVNFVLNLL